MSFVPDDFTVPTTFTGTGFCLEPLGPEHNERDHQAWMSSVDHIKSTPGFQGRSWPAPMSLEKNLADLEMHARHFENREGFTYSILDGDEVIGCVYIYPSNDETSDADIKSWVTASRSEMDETVWRELSDWLNNVWPFQSFEYAAR
jgi:hypothetical protein